VSRPFSLPAGCEIQWGGEFENQARANRRLTLVSPVSVAIIFGLLVARFHSVGQSLLILLNVPFALVGGIWALRLHGLNLNLSASVGFIALFGVAVLNGIVLVSHVNALRAHSTNMGAAIRQVAADHCGPF
jgi:cobalt-zinc-cadmium resistance protein CzcA